MDTQHMKIALLVDSKDYGGIETHIVNLAKGLHALGYSVRIVLLNNYGEHPVFESENFLRSILVKLDGGLTSFFTYVNASNFTLVHTHGYKTAFLYYLSPLNEK